jgi:GTPase SAR1 family protein
MFDIGKKTSFENVKKWNHEVDQKAKNSICKLLIGNKMDLVEDGTV